MQIVIKLSNEEYTKLKDGRISVNTMRKALLDGTVLKDVLKDFLEWYDLPFNDCLFKHTDEVIQEFMDYRKESTDADSN